ncbi:hypothetical protein N7453_003010 [Penicillium expansum]|nr:hypothetical protein N7453_003010 [Penicillium expansum]
MRIVQPSSIVDPNTISKAVQIQKAKQTIIIFFNSPLYKLLCGDLKVVASLGSSVLRRVLKFPRLSRLFSSPHLSYPPLEAPPTTYPSSDLPIAY